MQPLRPPRRHKYRLMRCGTNVPATPPAIQSGRASSIPCDIFGQPAQKAPHFSGIPPSRFRGICSDVSLRELKSHSSRRRRRRAMKIALSTYSLALCRDVVFKNPSLDIPFSRVAVLLPPLFLSLLFRPENEGTSFRFVRYDVYVKLRV